MKNLKVTKGEVICQEVFNQKGSYFKVTGKAPNSESVCNIITRNQERAEGNAKLIADAINTYNTSGLTPSELLQQRDELLESKTDLMDKIGSLTGYLELTIQGRFPIELKAVIEEAKELIQKIESHDTNR